MLKKSTFDSVGFGSGDCSWRNHGLGYDNTSDALKIFWSNPEFIIYHVEINEILKLMRINKLFYKYFSKKENYTVNCDLREFYISFVTAWDGRNGNGKIVFNHDKSKNNQGRWNQTNPGSFEETLLSNACNDSGVKEILDKVITEKN